MSEAESWTESAIDRFVYRLYSQKFLKTDLEGLVFGLNFVERVCFPGTAAKLECGGGGKTRILKILVMLRTVILLFFGERICQGSALLSHWEIRHLVLLRMVTR